MAKWQTVLDLDFTKQATQAINANGNWTIAGKTWVKENTANETVTMALTNGTGLVIQPAQNTDITGASRTAPILRLALSQLSSVNQGISWSSKLRLWVYISAASVTADFHNTFAGFDHGTSTNLRAYYALRGRRSAGSDGLVNRVISSQVSTDQTVALALATTNQIVMLDLDGICGPTQRVMFGDAATVWPKLKDLSWGIGNNTGNGLVGPTMVSTKADSSMSLVLAAGRGASATAFSTTIARVRLDLSI